MVACRAHFRGKSQLGDLGSRKFWTLFKASNRYFWGQNFMNKGHNLSTFLYTLISFEWCKDHLNQSLYVVVMSPTS
jgi:hypothetical protein